MDVCGQCTGLTYDVSLWLDIDDKPRQACLPALDARFQGLQALRDCAELAGYAVELRFHHAQVIIRLMIHLVQQIWWTGAYLGGIRPYGGGDRDELLGELPVTAGCRVGFGGDRGRPAGLLGLSWTGVWPQERVERVAGAQMGRHPCDGRTAFLGWREDLRRDEILDGKQPLSTVDWAHYR